MMIDYTEKIKRSKMAGKISLKRHDKLDAIAADQLNLRF